LSPTHFISFPLKDPIVKQKVQALHTEILALNLPNVDNSIFLRPEKFHLTIGVLKLYTKSDVEGAVKLLKDLSSEIYDLVGTRTTVAKLTGLEIMEDNPLQANVVYAKIEEGEALETLKRLGGSLEVIRGESVGNGPIKI
jgi:activating signal cointegrator complex subunit 1